MDLLTALFLAVLQAMTEFFPVSSSGHLAFAQALIPGFEQKGLVFDVWLHLATALSILLYYRRRLKDVLKKNFLFPLILATGVTGMAGFLLKTLAEKAFLIIPWVACNLFLTGLVLFLITKIRPGKGENVSLSAACIIGLAQGFAVFPGISRSGWTISAAVACGIRRDEAARFSFLAAVPVIFLVSVYEIFSTGMEARQFFRPEYSLSFLVAFVCGFAALTVFVPIVKKMRLHGFAIYCIILAGGMFFAYGI